MNRILISIIMITYNHEKYIEQAIESVLMQEGEFEIELLIGNDKSPDNTENILEKYKADPRVRVFNREKNMGATNNLWDLNLRARGKYIAVLEGDNYWITKDKLRNQLKILENNKEISLCYCNSYIINEKNEIIGKKVVESTKITTLNSLMKNRANIPTGTIFFINIYLNKHELSKIENLIKSSEIIGDLSLFAILIEKGSFIKLNEFTGVYRYITNNYKSTSYSARSDLYKEYELYKVFKGIAEYYKFDMVKKFFFIQHREYKLKKLITKENESLEKYFGKVTLNKKIKWIIYSIFKPFDDLYRSINKKFERN